MTLVILNRVEGKGFLSHDFACHLKPSRVEKKKYCVVGSTGPLLVAWGEGEECVKKETWLTEESPHHHRHHYFES